MIQQQTFIMAFMNMFTHKTKLTPQDPVSLKYCSPQKYYQYGFCIHEGINSSSATLYMLLKSSNPTIVRVGTLGLPCSE